MRTGLSISTLPFLLLKHLSSTSTTSFPSGFWNCFMLDLFSWNTPTISTLFFQIVLNEEFIRPNSHTSAFLFQYSICCITLTFPSMLKTFLLFITRAMLSHYHSPVKCSSGKVQGNFAHKVNNQSYYCHFPGFELMV